MRFVLYTQGYSPHELPLFRAASQVFDEAWYVVDHGWNGDPSRGGWQPELDGLKTVVLEEHSEADRAHLLLDLLDRETLIMYGTRGNPFEEAIVASSAIVVYSSERWLKPSRYLPGIFHCLQPGFVRKVVEFRHRFRTSPRFYYFGDGVYAVADMVRLVRMGSIASLEKRPCGKVILSSGCDKFRLWGYFVSNAHIALSGSSKPPEPLQPSHLRVLWVGRMLGWKCVDTLIRAVAAVAEGGIAISCTLVGNGPDKTRLKRMAEKFASDTEIGHLKAWERRPLFDFKDFVPMAEVRRLMHEHDIYVLPSNSYEGWGAVVNEALQEGMIVLASRESGAGVTMLPDECVFKAGDFRGLAEKIRTTRCRPGIGNWTPQEGARRLRMFADEVLKNEKEGLM